MSTSRIVGGGLTGLWTAYVPARTRSRRCASSCSSSEIAGFGASGRNGGWCTALFPQSTGALERRHGRDAALAMRRAMIDTVDEVGRVAARRGHRLRLREGRHRRLRALDGAARAARAEVAEARRYGVDGSSYWERRSRGAARPARRSAPARVRPRVRAAASREARARARRGRRGARRARSSSSTEVLDWSAAASASTTAPRHRARATRRRRDRGLRRRRCRRRAAGILPLYSLMIATEPLADDVWDEIGIEHGQTFSDYRHLLIYGQRTADNRFAFGGRGARYHWGSAIRSGVRPGRPGVRAPATHARATSSRRSATPRSPTAGAGRSGCRATGTPPRATTRRRGSDARAATSATASAPRTSPAARSPTC